MTLFEPRRAVFKFAVAEGIVDCNEDEKTITYSSAEIQAEINGTGYYAKTLIDSPALDNETIAEAAKDLVLTVLSSGKDR